MWSFFLTFLILKAADELNNVRLVVAEHFFFSPSSVSAAQLHRIGLGALFPAYIIPY